MMGLWFCASALGNLAAGLIGGHVKCRPAGYAAGSVRPLLDGAADLRCGVVRADCAGTPYAGEQ